MEQKDDKQACYECKLNAFILKWKPKKKKKIQDQNYLSKNKIKDFVPSSLCALFANIRSKQVKYEYVK